MLRLTMTAGCFVLQTASSAMLFSQEISPTAMTVGIAIGALTLIPTGWKVADRILSGKDWLGNNQNSIS